MDGSQYLPTRLAAAVLVESDRSATRTWKVKGCLFTMRNTKTDRQPAASLIARSGGTGFRGVGFAGSDPAIFAGTRTSAPETCVPLRMR